MVMLIFIKKSSMAYYSSFSIRPNIAWSVWHQFTSLFSRPLVPHHSMTPLYFNLLLCLNFLFNYLYFQTKEIPKRVEYLSCSVLSSQCLEHSKINIWLMNERTFYLYQVLKVGPFWFICYKYNFYINKHM